MMKNNPGSATIIRAILFFAALGLVSCQTYQIDPGSQRIRVFEAEPKGCIFVGEISSVQETHVEGKVSEPEMSLETRVDLRNKAHRLGGNILIFMKNKKTATASGTATAAPASTYSAAPDAAKKTPAASSAEEDKSDKKISTTFLATTFRCPASIVNQ